MGKIYAYHRFSTDEQDAQSQRNIIAKYAESKGLQIDEIISDEGISGSVSYKKGTYPNCYQRRIKEILL